MHYNLNFCCQLIILIVLTYVTDSNLEYNVQMGFQYEH